jgi:hypothetical protein
MDLAARKRPSDLLEYGVIATLMWRSSVSNRAVGRNRNRECALLHCSVNGFFTMQVRALPVLSGGLGLMDVCSFFRADVTGG